MPMPPLPRQVINSFAGKYNFLSNFYHSPFVWRGIVWPTVEHAYQAAKTSSMEDDTIPEFVLMWLLGTRRTAGEAQRWGRSVALRPDWEDVKLSIMKELLQAKFRDASQFRDLLLATGDAELIEGWGDRFWGVCGGVGENHLGRLLMEVREELRKEIEITEDAPTTPC
jgi:ribA/ribD-fused uncharacterized protein